MSKPLGSERENGGPGGILGYGLHRVGAKVLGTVCPSVGGWEREIVSFLRDEKSYFRS